MGRKYLGEEFDIHGGGMDLVFPHHECEIAQATASMGHQAVRYWMHNNMLTINGQKMGKSLGNFITLNQFFNGEHELLSKAYAPMVIRFFILSAHYRGTVDFSDEALQAAEKGLEKLMNGLADLERVMVSPACDAETERIVKSLRDRCYDAMNDDFATPQVISLLFEACTVVNKLIDHKATICADCLKELKETMHLFAEDILGLSTLKAQVSAGGNAAREEAFGKVVDMVLDLRAKAKAAKDWATSDQIRDALAQAGFEVKDTKDGVTWKLNK
jgi:cysteinyl-tRNA synthetase